MDETGVGVTKRREGMVLRVVGGILVAVGLMSVLGTIAHHVESLSVLRPFFGEGRESYFLGMWLASAGWGYVLGGVQTLLFLFGGVQLLRLRRSGWIAAVVVLGYVAASLWLYVATSQMEKYIETIAPSVKVEGVTVSSGVDAAALARAQRFVLFYLAAYAVVWVYVLSEWRRFFGAAMAASWRWQAGKVLLGLGIIVAMGAWAFRGATSSATTRLMQQVGAANPALVVANFAQMTPEGKCEAAAMLVRRLATEQNENVAEAVKWDELTLWLRGLRAEDIPGILEASRAGNVEVRSACYTLLGAIGTEEAQKRLAEAIEGKRDGAWETAVKALGRLHPKTTLWVLRGWDKPDSKSKLEQLRNLSGYRYGGVLCVGMLAATDADVEVRGLAMSVLGHVPGYNAEGTLKDGLRDKEVWVRGAACRGLAKIATESSIPALIEVTKGTADKYQDPRMGGEQSLHKDAAFALAGITGREMEVDAAAWEKWWAEVGSTFDLKKDLARRLFTPLPAAGPASKAVEKAQEDPRTKAAMAQVHALRAIEGRQMKELAPELARYLALPDEQAGMKFMAAKMLAEWGYGEGIAWLIERVENEEGKGDYFFRDFSTLGAATGVNFFGDRKRWEAWWKENGSRFPSAASRFGGPQARPTSRGRAR